MVCENSAFLAWHHRFLNNNYREEKKSTKSMKIEIYCKNEDDAFAFILMRAALEFRVWIFIPYFL